VHGDPESAKGGTMRSIFLVFLVVAGLAAPGAPAELKIGYVDYQYIFSKYEGTKEAQTKYDKEVQKWDQEASKRQKEIKDLKDQIDKRSLILSAERKKALDDSLHALQANYDQFLQSKYNEKRGEVLTKNAELVKPIVEKIQLIIEKIAKEENYDFVLDRRAGAVLYAKSAYDLTERVLGMLNKEK
jgi:outer membrane protein